MPEQDMGEDAADRNAEDLGGGAPSLFVAYHGLLGEESPGAVD